MLNLWKTCLAQSRRTGFQDGFQACPIQWKAEDFPAWSTKFVALMQTKGLFSAVMGQDDTPDELEQLVDETKEAEREKIMKGIKNRNNEVWCNQVLVLDNCRTLAVGLALKDLSN